MNKAKKLRAAIEGRGFKSQAQFALAARINPCILSGLLLGHRRITGAYGPRIQRALDKGPRST